MEYQPLPTRAVRCGRRCASSARCARTLDPRDEAPEPVARAEG
ncbi:MAG: hypothetical protein U0326_15015 [Polyangiales bacterium]